MVEVSCCVGYSKSKYTSYWPVIFSVFWEALSDRKTISNFRKKR